MPKSPILLALLFAATTATAQQNVPGGHFVESWDLDGDGQVTLAEASQVRQQIV
ncbi:MAG: hypothetical protein JJ869_06510 [Marivita sp.]|uniref:hypothetical protein n=1 Tax=Marivita sp. TaxID=2003365 RepID=UPI001B2ECF2D|nr:hypothetical protein [Marivita sp.]MBO6883220.1 hypothetical protein [Marivita sp.]